MREEQKLFQLSDSKLQTRRVLAGQDLAPPSYLSFEYQIGALSSDELTGKQKSTTSSLVGLRAHCTALCKCVCVSLDLGCDLIVV